MLRSTVKSHLSLLPSWRHELGGSERYDRLPYLVCTFTTVHVRSSLCTHSIPTYTCTYESDVSPRKEMRQANQCHAHCCGGEGMYGSIHLLFPYGNWNSDNRKFNFKWNNPENENDNFRSRPAMQGYVRCFAPLLSTHQAFFLLQQEGLGFERSWFRWRGLAQAVDAA